MAKEIVWDSLTQEEAQTLENLRKNGIESMPRLSKSSIRNSWRLLASLSRNAVPGISAARR